MFVFACGTNDQAIVAPSLIAVTPGEVDFGKIPVGSTVRRELVIANSGQRSLSINRIRFVGDASQFALTQVPGLIEAKDKAGTILEYRPTEPGIVSTTLYVDNNSDNNPAVQIKITAEGVDRTFCGDCDSPPENICLTDSDLRVFDRVGRCRDGSCRYERRVIPCPSMCVSDACTDYEVPTATVSISPVEAYTDDKLVASANITSDHLMTANLQYQWFKNGQIQAQEVDKVLSSELTAKGEVWEVVVTPVLDGVDGQKTSAAKMVRNSPPTATNVTITPQRATEQSTLSCSAATTSDKDGDTVTLLYNWRVNGQSVSQATTLDGSSFNRDDVVICELSPFDGQVSGSTVASNAVTITNSAPRILNVLIGPSSPNKSTTVTATIAGWFDPDGDSPTYNYAWSVNGVAVSTRATLEASLFSRGDTIELAVEPYDNYQTGVIVRSNQLTVGNAPPSINQVALLPTAPRTLNDIVAYPLGYHDFDGDPASYTYSWSINGTRIVGGATLAASQTSRDDRVFVEVTPSDGLSRGQTVSSTTIVIGNSAPVVGAVYISPTTGNEETIFSCITSGWRDDDGDPPRFRFQWYINSSPSVTSSTISNPSIQRGDRIQCEATPFDAYGSGLGVLSGTVDVENSPPEIAAVLISPAIGSETTVFSCSPQAWYDADGDPEAYFFQWFVNQTPSVTTATISGQHFDKDDEIACRVTPTDAIDLGTPITSSPVIIQNSLPSLLSANISPQPLQTSDQARILAQGWFDPDGDPELYRYTWFVNGQPILLLNSPTLANTNFIRGDSLYAQVTPIDTESGSSVFTSTVIVQNTPPQIASAFVNPASGNKTTEFACVAGGWFDADSDSSQYRYVWYVNSSSVSTASSLNGNSLRRGDLVRCELTPFDGIDFGSSITTATITIQNASPTIQRVQVDPAIGTESTTFACEAIGWQDPDGDSEDFERQWFVGGTFVSDGEAITGALFDKNQTIRCRLRPKDNFGGYGAWMFSNTATVTNSIPGAPTATITPARATDADDLVCAILVPSVDLDNDPIQYSYSWTNGTDIIEGVTLTSTHTQPGETWLCTVTPRDDVSVGTSTSVSTGPLIEYCRMRNGSTAACSAADCYTILRQGMSTGDGLYWLYSGTTGTNYQTYCLMDVAYDGGGWTLAAVISDDNSEQWTWDNQQSWTSPVGSIGTVNQLSQDFRSPAMDSVSANDLLFVHSPSGIWASYNDVSRTESSLSESLSQFPSSQCFDSSEGTPMTAGTLGVAGSLCTTNLYINPLDQDGTNNCICPTCDDHAFGPAWNVSGGNTCFFTNPGSAGSLGPSASVSDIEGGNSLTGNPLGFGQALGLNTGTPGSGQNRMNVYVRRVDQDGDGFARFADCNDARDDVFPGAGDVLGDGIEQDCDGMDCQAGMVGAAYFAICPDNGFSYSQYDDRCSAANYEGLASIRNATEQAAVDDLIRQSGTTPNTSRQAYYIGLNTQTGRFSDGSVSAYRNWYVGEPSGDGTCTVANWLITGQWNDISCGWIAGGGICQRREPVGVKFTRVYEAETQLAHLVGRQEGNGWSANTVDDSPEHMAYGPYATDWPETVLNVRFRLMIDVVTTAPQQVVSVDVFDATTGQVLVTRAILRNEFLAPYTYQDFDISVDVSGRSGNAMETRVYWNDVSYVRLDSVFVSE